MRRLLEWGVDGLSATDQMLLSASEMSSWPGLDEVAAARPRVYAVMQRSPMLRHPLLDEWLGCEAWVKHENHNPTGAFKIRGGLNLLAQLSRGRAAPRRRSARAPAITASRLLCQPRCMA